MIVMKNIKDRLSITYTKTNHHNKWYDITSNLNEKKEDESILVFVFLLFRASITLKAYLS